MSKATFLVSALVISLGFIGGLTAAPAHAQAATCDNLVITNTGAGSTNVVKCADSLNLVVECVNSIYELNASSQQALSGAATVSDAVNGGSAQSGSAQNSNGQTVSIGATCGETVTEETPVTPTPSTDTTTPTPGKGSSTPTQAIAALPNTAANTTMGIVAGVAAAIAVAFAASRLAVYAYRRASEK